MKAMRLPKTRLAFRAAISCQPRAMAELECVAPAGNAKAASARSAQLRFRSQAVSPVQKQMQMSMAAQPPVTPNAGTRIAFAQSSTAIDAEQAAALLF